jgi:hypothetical protein
VLTKQSNTTFFPFRISTPKDEGVLSVSKWTKYQVLLDDEEMADLFDSLAPLTICSVSEPVKKGSEIIDLAEFLDKYQTYISGLRAGILVDESLLRRYFSSALTCSSDLLYAIAVGGDKYLIKPIKPVIQMQAHHFFYSDLDKKFHPMVLSTQSVTWGVQFSYPQLYQDPKTHRIAKVVDSPEFPNTALFAKLRKWLKNHTLPTPFFVEKSSYRVNTPIRIGKKCRTWIQNHPQLKDKGIHVH